MVLSTPRCSPSYFTVQSCFKFTPAAYLSLSHSPSEQIHAEDGVAKSHLHSRMLSTGRMSEGGILHLITPATASQAFRLNL